MEKIPRQPAENCKAHIDYPCVWRYTIIGTSQEAVQNIVAEHLGDAPYSLSVSRTSGSGKYISMTLEAGVNNDRQRIRLYHDFADHPDIKVVL